MPISSPDQPAGTIRDLGLPARAVTALTRAGITDVGALAALTRRELSAVAGLGPGMVAAIRTVVPEPPARLPAAGGPPAAPAADREPAPAEEESPAAPAIPSFASLRGPRRRSAVDLLLPDPPPPGVPADPAAPAAPSPSRPPTAPLAPTGPAAPAAVRPPDYADLLRLGVHVARTVLTAPARCLRRLLG
ncbi:DNA-directed RNA polymerase subunit alpha C-terminal domain-containing protein [Blastococcus sp. HT6-30]|uniref:DNA-directed RNA polymerase subunit alpha C-terminal domain-containing protein n=1 Tax=Blastococcus sp. HT6-30 TaxID=3144843 RepID=UPI003219D6E4